MNAVPPAAVVIAEEAGLDDALAGTDTWIISKTGIAAGNDWRRSVRADDVVIATPVGSAGRGATPAGRCSPPKPVSLLSLS